MVTQSTPISYHTEGLVKTEVTITVQSQKSMIHKSKSSHHTSTSAYAFFLLQYFIDKIGIFYYAGYLVANHF